MLSLSNLTSSTGASVYFEIDDYYTKDEAKAELQRTTSFQGELAKELNLPDYIDKEIFKDLLDGIIKDYGDKKNTKTKNENLENYNNYPITQKLGRIVLGHENPKKEESKNNKKSLQERYSGLDMTFSAPKSLSILSEVLGKEELSKIHDQAVSTSLRYAEQNLIQTRIRKGSSKSADSTVTYKQTKKALFATFRHNTSRNLDPQLHTHAIAINITKQEKEKKYRSAEFSQIFKNKMLLGAIYRSEIANELIKKGYHIEQTNIDGRFEIKNFPKELMDKFSSRRQEIQKELEKVNNGYNDAKLSSKIALKTRSKKVKTQKEILRQEWQNTVKGYDLNSKFNILNKDNNNNHKSNSKDLNISQIINNSLNQITQTESVFTKQQLLKQALISYIEQGVTINEIEREINQQIKNNNIIDITNSFVSKEEQKDNRLQYFSTKSEIEKEAEIIHITKQVNSFENNADNINQYCVFEDKENISQFTDGQKYNLLTTGQKQAVDLIATSKEQIIGIQGSAGTGKTYMLNTAKDLIKNKGYEFIALAPSSSATKLLKDDAKIENANSLQHFLTRYGRFNNHKNTLEGQDLIKTKQYFEKKIIILDEASMVSNNQMLSLINITKNLDIKLWTVYTFPDTSPSIFNHNILIKSCLRKQSKENIIFILQNLNNQQSS